MDTLLTSAEVFSSLLNTEYEFVLGKKGKTVKIRLVFQKKHFHHLAGLHHLKDLQQIKGDRGKIFDHILDRSITSDEIEKSFFYPEIKKRLELLQHLENIFDSNNIIFKYNADKNCFSLIQADYLLVNENDTAKIFTFLAKNTDGNFFCRSFFPIGKQDYSVGQTNWTILLKKKINLISKTETVLYHHKNYP